MLRRHATHSQHAPHSADRRRDQQRPWAWGHKDSPNTDSLHVNPDWLNTRGRPASRGLQLLPCR